MSTNFTEYCSGDSGVQEVCDLYDMVEAVQTASTGLKTGLNTFFLIISAALVFFMQTGFAMLCAGSVRQKNVKNIMLKNLLDACIGAVAFYLVGFGFAYGGDGQPGKRTFLGNSYFGLKDYDSFAFFFFQFAFAATAATIVAGTVAERCKMSAYVCYSMFLTGFVYPVIVHAIWSPNGFLSAFLVGDDKFKDVGTVDFAGSGVVHMTGGATALIAAIILGPRKGRFHDNDGNPLEEPHYFPAHSTALQVLGTFILWVGWYGFNPGSALIIDNENSASTASLAAVTTTMGAATGAITAIVADSLVESCKTGETTYDVTMCMNGLLGGLVAVTAGCAVIEPWAAILIGGTGGLIYMGASKLLVRLRIDDAVDAIPVHLANGMWGILAVGLFANGERMATAGYNAEHEGLFYEWASDDPDGNLMVAQISGMCFIFGWVAVIMTPFFFMLNVAGLFRVDELEEKVGLDISHHRGAAYELDGPKKEDVEELMEIRASRHGRVQVPEQANQDDEDDEDEEIADGYIIKTTE